MRQEFPLFLLHLLFVTPTPITGSKMKTRSQTYEQNFDATKGSASALFEAQAFAYFADRSPHVAVPVLMECISVADDSELRLEDLPRFSVLGGDDQAWLRETLCACGFEVTAQGNLKASQETLDQLRKGQNAARRRAHTEAAASRGALLDDKIQELTRSAANAHTLGQARAALRTFLIAFDGQPAVGPLLLGVAALLKAQAMAGAAAQCWHVDRAAFLNGGDALVEQVMPLMHALRVLPNPSAADSEAGRADELALEVEAHAWTPGELGALASLLERKCARQPLGGRATGTIASSGRKFTPRELATWQAWLGSVMGVLLTRLSP